MEIIKMAFLDGVAFAVKVGSFSLILLMFLILLAAILGLIGPFSVDEVDEDYEDDDMNEV